MENATKYLIASLFVASIALGYGLGTSGQPGASADCLIQTGGMYEYQMNDTTIERNLTKEYYDFPPNQTCTRGEVCTYLCGNGTVKTCNMGWHCVENV